MRANNRLHVSKSERNLHMNIFKSQRQWNVVLFCVMFCMTFSTLYSQESQASAEGKIIKEIRLEGLKRTKHKNLIKTTKYALNVTN